MVPSGVPRIDRDYSMLASRSGCVVICTWYLHWTVSVLKFHVQVPYGRNCGGGLEEPLYSRCISDYHALNLELVKPLSPEAFSSLLQPRVQIWGKHMIIRYLDP